MAKSHHKMFTCSICQTEKRLSVGMPGEMINTSILDFITRKHPDWSPESFICFSCLEKLRAQYIQSMMEEEQEELISLKSAVDKSLEAQESQNINVLFDRELTLGEKIADKVADFGGSWKFISIFGFVIVVWMFINSISLLKNPFDPYPYILLNLVLSCLAAIQAPIIMMSQNRQEDKDRLQNEYDYKVNLKAELEIRHLHAKLDMLLTHQWHRLLEIQQIQMNMMDELAHRKTS